MSTWSTCVAATCWPCTSSPAASASPAAPEPGSCTASWPVSAREGGTTVTWTCCAPWRATWRTRPSAASDSSALCPSCTPSTTSAMLSSRPLAAGSPSPPAVTSPRPRPPAWMPAPSTWTFRATWSVSRRASSRNRWMSSVNACRCPGCSAGCAYAPAKSIAAGKTSTSPFPSNISSVSWPTTSFPWAGGRNSG